MFLSTDLQQFVGQQMSLDHYETFDDLVEEALTLLRDKRRAEFYEQIDIGRQQIENGECTVLTTEVEVHAFFNEIKQGTPAQRAEPAA